MATEERCVEGGRSGDPSTSFGPRVALRSSPVPRFGTGLLGFTGFGYGSGQPNPYEESGE